eukprot:scaffold1265_cov173-Ochromonas_danica.AAC.8
MSALEDTITFTSPQKYAGKRGISILDNKTPEIVAFEKTVKDRARMSGYHTRYDPTSAERQFFMNNSSRSSLSTTANTNETALTSLQNSRSNSRGGMMDSLDKIALPEISPVRKSSFKEDPDIQYITAVKKKIYDDARHLRSGCQPRTCLSPVRFHARPQPGLIATKTRLRMSLSPSRDMPCSPTYGRMVNK